MKTCLWIFAQSCLSVASVYSCPSCSRTFLSSATHRTVLPSFPQLHIVQSYLPFLSYPSHSLTFLSSAAHRAVLPSFPQLPICHSCNMLMCCSLVCQSSGASTEFAGGSNSPHLWKAPSVWWCRSAAPIRFDSVWIIAMVDPESLLYCRSACLALAARVALFLSLLLHFLDLSSFSCSLGSMMDPLFMFRIP